MCCPLGQFLHQIHGGLNDCSDLMEDGFICDELRVMFCCDYKGNDSNIMVLLLLFIAENLNNIFLIT